MVADPARSHSRTWILSTRLAIINLSSDTGICVNLTEVRGGGGVS